MRKTKQKQIESKHKTIPSVRVEEPTSQCLIQVNLSAIYDFNKTLSLVITTGCTRVSVSWTSANIAPYAQRSLSSVASLQSAGKPLS